jgi:ABC-type dipeptide/oligopeptide/nickel transport system ATPase subunit
MYLSSEAGWWVPQVRDHFTASDQVPAILDKFGILSDKLDIPPGPFSSGERQRMTLIRALS